MNIILLPIGQPRLSSLNTLTLAGENLLPTRDKPAKKPGGPASFERTARWTLQAYTVEGKRSEISRIPPTLSFRNGKLSGHGGINRLFGSYSARRDGSITLLELGATEMVGSRRARKQENSLLNLLPAVTTWLLEEDTLLLSDGTERNQLSFTAAT